MTGRPRISVADRLAARTVEQPSGCWEYDGKPDRDGYRRIGEGRKTFLAHRASWVVKYGEIPEGLFVLHKCDNRACIRPDHLFLGTALDNNADMRQKGRERYLSGEENPMSKLTGQEVQEIKDSYALGVVSMKLIGDLYGICAPHVHDLVHGKKRSNG